MSAPSGKRIEWIDNAKGIGILLVVLYHFPLITDFKILDLVGDWITMFYMPLFFFLSGMFAPKHSYGKRVRRLLQPYVFFYIVACILFLIKCVLKHEPCSISYLLSPFAGATIGYENTPIWFLLSLSEVTLIYYFISKISNSYLFVLASLSIGITGYILGQQNILSYFYISVSLLCFPFYALSGRFADTIKKPQHWSIYVGTTFLSLLTFYLLGAKSNISQNYIPYHYEVFLLAAFSAVIGMCGISQLLSKFQYFGSVLNFFGRNSLIILCTHMMLMFIPSAAYSIVGANYIATTLALVALLIFETGIIFIFNKSKILKLIIGQ